MTGDTPSEVTVTTQVLRCTCGDPEAHAGAVCPKAVAEPPQTSRGVIIWGKGDD